MSKVWISSVVLSALLVTGGVAAGVVAHSNRIIVDPPQAPTSSDVLIPLEPKQSDATVLQARVEQLAQNPALGTLGAQITDVTTGETIFTQAATTPMLPASSVKTLTAAAALLQLGPQDRIETPLYQDGSTLIIKASGDVWLDNTALDAMAAAAQGEVTEVLIDTSIWQGANFLPGWEQEDIAAGFIAPIEPAMLYGARIGAESGDVPRSATPAADVAKALAQRVGAASVGFGAVRGAEIASVSSPVLSQRLEEMMEESDNVMAEAIGRELSATDPTGEVLRILNAAGFDTQGVTLVDNSGLSTDNRLPAALLEQIMHRAATDEALRPLLATLPTAGSTGTLEDRYPNAGRGWVRAKTGTLTAVTALTGVVPGQNGHLYSFALISNDSEILPARAAVDAIAAALREAP
ncbi:D-alanyl-D-alanine carboxypeptidase/D-alanyl-D-alanine-endopeptidase [Corynebacterium sp. 35RC1]|nr:D-alanyl-D-alanine carboxypeptidase/D-alanyl-D-alanine-endopeptidase [Corynebacterium sp. 35RC1]